MAATTTTAPAASGSASTSTGNPLLAKLKAFVIAQFLPLGLIFVTLVGILLPTPGAWLDRNTPLNTISIVGIFFISGLQLQTAELKRAVAAWRGLLFSYLSILVISPLLSLWIAKWNLGPPEFSDGLALFMAMPTTVSSGVLMTTEAGGNTALAIMLSAGTNLIGVGTSPLFIGAFLAEGQGAAGKSKAFNVADLLYKLALAILLPLVLGKSLRYFTRVTDWVKGRRLTLKYTSACLLISVPWMAMSSGSGLIRAAPPSSILVLLVLGIVLHAALLAFNYSSCWVLNKLGAKMPLSETKAVVIGASQKTVNTAVSVINFLPAAVGDRGLLTLPCVLAHLMQILMDAFLVTYWKKFKDAPAESSSSATTTVSSTTTPAGTAGTAAAAAAPAAGDAAGAGTGKSSSSEVAGRTGGLAAQDGYTADASGMEELVVVEEGAAGARAAGPAAGSAGDSGRGARGSRRASATNRRTSASSGSVGGVLAAAHAADKQAQAGQGQGEAQLRYWTGSAGAPASGGSPEAPHAAVGAGRPGSGGSRRSSGWQGRQQGQVDSYSGEEAQASGSGSVSGSAAPASASVHGSPTGAAAGGTAASGRVGSPGQSPAAARGRGNLNLMPLDVTTAAGTGGGEPSGEGEGSMAWP